MSTTSSLFVHARPIFLVPLLAFLGGCSTLSTQLLVTPNPVLIGPVERIGGNASPAPSDAHSVYMQTQAVSGSSASDSGSQSFSEQPASTAQDFQLHRRLGGDPNAIVRVNQQKCSGFVFASVGGALHGHGCQLFGVAYASPYRND